jgi:putative lipase involved disintegration of autophagic bodies
MREKTLIIFYFIISHYILISFTQQIPFTSDNDKYQRQGILGFYPPPSAQCQHTQTNTKVFKLKHILHHGTTPSNKHLFRQLNIDDIEKDPLHTTAITFKEHVINSITVGSSGRTAEMNVEYLHVKEIPNAKDKKTVLSMAKMSYDAYIELETLNDHWIDLEDWDVGINVVYIRF